MKDLAVIFSGALFFTAMYFLFKQALVTAAAIMGFSLLWYMMATLCHKIDLNALVETTNKGGNS